MINVCVLCKYNKLLKINQETLLNNAFIYFPSRDKKPRDICLSVHPSLTSFPFFSLFFRQNQRMISRSKKQCLPHLF